MSTVRTTGEIDAVAAYATVDGAERAVAHLVRLGFDEHDLKIGPRDFEVVNRQPLRARLARWLRAGAIAGAAAMAVIAIGREVGGQALVDSVLPLAAKGALAGVAIGLVVGLASYRRQRALEFLTEDEVVAPTRYEIEVDRDQDRARHGLAQWWDPAAPPARWRQPA